MDPAFIQINGSFIASGFATLLAIYSAVLSYFARREIINIDMVKSLTYKNEREILVIKTEIRQHALDLLRATDRADEIVENYKANFRELNIKLDCITGDTNQIRITCAGHMARIPNN